VAGQAFLLVELRPDQQRLWDIGDIVKLIEKWETAA
jgi:hypothetical protein